MAMQPTDIPTGGNGGHPYTQIAGGLLAVGLGWLLAHFRSARLWVRSAWDLCTAILTGASALKKRQDEHAAQLQELREAIRAIRDVVAPEGGVTTREMLINAQADVATTRSAMARLAAQITVLMDDLVEPRFHCGPDGACIMANHALCELYGRAPGEMHGNSWLEAVHHDDREAVFARWRAAVKNDIPWEDEYRVVARGAVVTVNARVRAIRDATGAIIMYAGSVRLVAKAKSA